MKEENFKTVIDVVRELKVSSLTLKKWEKKGFIKVKREKVPKYKQAIRAYYPDDINLLKWLKKMGGSHQSNEFYLKLLLEYINTGKISPERLGWPPK